EAERRGDIEGAPDLRAEEAGRRDAGDLDLVAVELELATDRARVGAELAPPEALADHDGGGVAAAPIVGGVEHAAEQRRDAERVEEVAADEEAARPSDRAGLRQVVAPGAPGDEHREGLLPRAQLLEERVGEIGAPAVEAALGPFVLLDGDDGELLGRAH